MYFDWDDPWQPLRRLRRQVNRAFDDVVVGGRLLPGFVRRRVSFPHVNVVETSGELTVECELPGVKVEDLEVTLRGRQLNISGGRPEEEVPKANYHRRERGGGKFSRTIELAVDVDQEAMKATLKDGVLTVKLPKSPEAKPRQIPVKSKEQGE